MTGGISAAQADPGVKPSIAHGRLGALMLGALGVVYGDIGTSPLYTLKTALEWRRRRHRRSGARHAFAGRVDAADNDIN